MAGLVLPTEILVDVLLHVAPKEIKAMCASKPMYAAICTDSAFQSAYARKWNVSLDYTTPVVNFKLRTKGTTVFVKPMGIDLDALDSLSPSTIMDDGVRVFLGVNDVEKFRERLEMIESAMSHPSFGSYRPKHDIDSVLYGQFYRGDDKAGIYNYSEKSFVVAGSAVNAMVAAGKLKDGLSTRLRYGLDQGLVFPKRYLRIVEADLGLD